MKTRINILNYSLDFEKINDLYDFYHFKTSKKFISKGALFLDTCSEHAESIAFDYGISAFGMFLKGSISLLKLNLCVNDNDIAIRKVEASELKPSILLRLLLNSLCKSSFKDFSFNNLTGRLYYYLPEWISKNGNFIKALDISIFAIDEKNLRFDANACTFTRVSVFKNKPDFSNAFFEISTKKTFKRVNRTKESDVSNLFIRKTPSNKKTEIVFLDFSEIKKKSSKCYAVYQIIAAFNAKFSELANISFKEIELLKKIDTKRDEDFSEKSAFIVKQKGLNLINFCLKEEDGYDLDLFESSLKESFPAIASVRNSALVDDKFNVALIHNRKYYLENGYNDPYSNIERNKVVQCITDEDACSNLSPTIIKTILKEIAIKNDIINQRKITLDDWKSYRFDGPISFGILDDNTPYFLEIDSDGYFKTIKSNNFLHTFKELKYEKYKHILENSGKDNCMLIADNKGNVNLITSTGVNTYPYDNIFASNSPRGKESRINFLAGITDINLYEFDGSQYYNAGIIGKGMNSSIPKGSLLYKVTVVEGDSIIENLLKTMSVMFVKYNSFTVLPYPFKYLHEWIKMNKEYAVTV